ncbi:MAG: PQQ-binding-like beta-propeller repeat protein [Nanobdellota archaeon]
MRGQSLRAILGRKQISIDWSFSTQETLLVSPLLIQSSSHTRIIVPTQQGTLHCLDSNGSKQWTYTVHNTLSEEQQFFVDMDSANRIVGTPLYVPSTDTILCCSQQGMVHAINLDGTLNWKKKIGDTLHSSPVLGEITGEGSQELIISTSKGNILILSLEGKLLQTIETDHPFKTTPLIMEKRIIVGDQNGILHAFSFSGKELWTFSTTDVLSVAPTPTHTTNGTIILLQPSHDGILYAITLDGEHVWSFQTQGSLVSPVQIADINDDGKNEICFGSCDNTVYCITTTGTLLWSFETNFWITVSPLVTSYRSKRALVAGSLDNTLYLLDGAGTYSFHTVPGISGVVHQPGHSSLALHGEVGSLESKKHCDIMLEGNITGLSLSHDTKSIIVTTKQGNIYSLRPF